MYSLLDKSRLLLAIPGVDARFGPAGVDPGELMWLADRAAVSRERAGFHYPSDTQAGKELAQKLADNILNGTISCPYFKNTILKNAKLEWT